MNGQSPSQTVALAAAATEWSGRLVAACGTADYHTEAQRVIDEVTLDARLEDVPVRIWALLEALAFRAAMTRDSLGLHETDG